MYCGLTCYYRFFVCKMSRNNIASIKLNLPKSKKKKNVHKIRKKVAFKYSLTSRKCNIMVQKFLVSLVCKLSRLNSSWLGIYDCTLFHKDKVYGVLLIEEDTAQGCSTHGNLELSAFLRFLDPPIPHKFATVLVEVCRPNSIKDFWWNLRSLSFSHAHPLEGKCHSSAT